MWRLALAAIAAMAVQPVLAQDAAPAPAVLPLPRVLIHTTAGDMIVEVEAKKAPVTAANFLNYVDRKRLDGTIFYRIVKVDTEFGFVQFGAQNDPKRVLPPIAHEPTTQTGLSHTDGTLSMPRFAPGSAQGEFTIMVGDQSRLDADPSAPGDNLGYAAFGHVVGGRDVLVHILDTPIDPDKTDRGSFKGELPAEPVRIVSARRVPAP